MEPKVRPKRRRLPRPERRGVILQTALRQFAEQGYEANLDDIARLAGVTKPVLYDHFCSKEDLFLEVVKAIRKDLLDAGRIASFPSSWAPQEKVRALLDHFFLQAESNPGAIRVLLSVAHGKPELELAVSKIQEEVTDALVELFCGVMNRPHLGNREGQRLRLQMEFIKQGVHGLAEWWPARKNVRRAHLVDAVMSVVWSGLSGSRNF